MGKTFHNGALNGNFFCWNGSNPRVFRHIRFTCAMVSEYSRTSNERPWLASYVPLTHG
jgi:hypothetical protein